MSTLTDIGAALFAVATLAAPAPAAQAPHADGRQPPAIKNAEFLEQLAATRGFSLGNPGSVRLTPTGDAVLFLRASGPRSFVSDLWVYDVASGAERVLLTADQILRGQEEVLTPEELARRERARTASARGIASYSLSRDGRTLLVPLSGRLFVVDITDRAAPRTRELPQADGGFPIDPGLSPDARKVASVRGGNLYVQDVASGAQAAITSGATGHVTFGAAEFVAQEEMGRLDGYWFTADSRSILYQRTDTAGLETFTIADPANPGRPAQTWPYPRAGRANADVRLFVAPADGGTPQGSHVEVLWDRARFPYLARVDTSENAPVTILVQDRAQTEQLLLRVDLATGATTTLVRETDPAWLVLSGVRWLRDGSGFLWMTQQDATGDDGWRLELRNPDGSLASVIVAGDQHLAGVEGLTHTGDAVLVSRSPDAIGDQLWLYPIRARSAPRAITDTAARTSHGVTLSRESGVWLHSTPGPDGAPTWTLRRGLTPDAPALGALRSVAEACPILPEPRFTTVSVDGRSLNAVVLRPRDFDPALRYPVINSVYAGPTTTVVNAPARAHLRNQWLADQGFIVVAIDARGTPGRGRAWERAVKGDLIAVPLAEQAAATLALCDAFPQMDRQRIGVTGWSFGGYFSVMAALRRPDVFRAAVAGAPVIDWRDYDTHYTERYMGLPEQNQAGYDAASALTYAKDLRVPLLLVHGTADDNVYMINSLRMADALFRAGRPFEFLPLSGFTHAVGEPAAVVRLQSRTVGFFKEHLGEPAPR